MTQTQAPTPAVSPAWQALSAHRADIAATDLRTLFARDPQRFERFCLHAAGLTLDYSKNRITKHTLELLVALARERQLEHARNAMFAGARINSTEDRAVLHTALRNPAGSCIEVDGENVMPAVLAVRQRVGAFAEAVRESRWTGYSGEVVTDVVNIGIGGSDLGPAMACEALAAHGHPRLKLHFVSNVDGDQLARVLASVNPARTLFIIASKTFTTIETMTNAASARDWFLASGAGEKDIARHFVAVSTNAARVAEFGIAPDNMFGFWDWVGGRYSMWSAVGLPIALCVGRDGFEAMLDGAHEMDRHFSEAPLEVNMPVILALLGVWYRNFFDAGSLCIAPYAQALSRMPAYLQQLEMESNGKSVTRDGQPAASPTCPVVWGEPGTNGQHAFFQLLHQGTDLIPVDFIAPLKASHNLPGHHRLLLANCIAQSKALMIGKTADEVRAELAASGMNAEAAEALVPHRVFPGNRPSNTLLMPELAPRTLGALIALYEHKVFVQGVIWDVNSFDQWGVELGKQIATRIAGELAGAAPGDHDASTAGLIALARAATS
ncbi:glucose-6-phosphate isomerase [Azoarcus sp. L1K30]|uniref:glucose-6-phosphate isomerase n=1 Tax=Azoarcus sp. L1K30 TaxID=2820277 RepID=UPI001B82BD86|nr:glucose-6-phosphate isomerase [Azoarcus sp. L1K30]MBR0568723.1 glucose-6-phosphate isomerase [Azoarcus sp. L1K30]